MTQISMLDVQPEHVACPSAIDSAHPQWWLSVDHCVHAIDDDPQFLDIVSCVLQSFQLNVERYPCAERFLATSAMHDADCLLLDMRMPQMCGVDLLETLRARHSSTPVLMLSAYHDTPDVV